ncbi:SDR family oxidoreductase [Pseudonocardia sp. TRM90224]|uniref:SDR family oxidoreductase n=1 Tax=Pseudonocardia sp. TRM90224 TaxID=2812678 RepID=UPI001E2A16ED|nr:NAD(P)-dependent oxidoreductase [Pseudonocardia sp. TRM90224]
MRVLVLGAGGQVGKALVAALPWATALGRAELDITALDITDPGSAGVEWAAHDVVVNAAAYTDVDGAETAEGRVAAWQANACGPAALARVAGEHGLTLVHISSEYVFDGRSPEPYPEDAPFAPLSAYGAAKAAGDIAVGALARHYIVRPTWLVGDGRNFVRTMIGLAAKGVEPAVVADQVGRLTFARDVAAAVVHLLMSDAPFGTYNVTASGEPASWADVARATYQLAGRADLTVTDTTTEAYFAGKPDAAPRPRNSVLDLTKAEKVGIELPSWRSRLAEYVNSAN